MLRSIRFALPAFAFLLLGAASARAEKAVPTYDQAVREQAPKILETLKSKGYKNVGVLKFLVRNEGGVLRDNFGPINRTLADRLELALLLAVKSEDDLGVVFRASDQVDKYAQATENKRITHRTERGRSEFFKLKPSPFYLPWKPNERVEPDAFLTGEATLSADLTRLTVRVQVFGNKSPDRLKLQDLTEFTVASDPRTLIESGVSFVGARGPYDDDTASTPFSLKVSKDAPKPEDSEATWKKRAETRLSEMKNLPIQIEILYNDQPQSPEPNPFRPPTERDNVLLRVADPLPNQKVTFRLTNRGTEEFGVVIQVNGRNTIYMEEQNPLDCYKWILKPGQSTLVEGFLQPGDAKAEEFNVRSDAESEKEEVKYGRNVGTFCFTVFRAATSVADQKLVKKEKERDTTTAMIGRGTEQLTTILPSNLDSFRGELEKLTKKEQATSGSRGVIVPGNEIDKAVKNVAFSALPDPAFSATIRYFTPKSLK